ncbi:MAG: methyltransferase domain-containing protein [Pirellulales bacterium]|nr:methyltransferase domain-containing protein [Pirellulales bacterium]
MSATLNYARLTLEDPNPIKRLLQRRRLHDALRWLPGLDDRAASRILDCGGGDGCFAQWMAERAPAATIVCYEPAARLRTQAVARLADVPNVELVGDLADLPRRRFDTIYCLEVLEHLPRRTMHQVLGKFAELATPEATIVLGVPNELYLAAAAKGLFRLTRRWGAFDAQPREIVRAMIGRPTRRRLRTKIGPGLPYYPHHLGFDHRRLAHVLERHFDVVEMVGSPLPRLPLACNSEIYLICRPKRATFSRATSSRRRSA